MVLKERCGPRPPRGPSGFAANTCCNRVTACCGNHGGGYRLPVDATKARGGMTGAQKLPHHAGPPNWTGGGSGYVPRASVGDPAWRSRLKCGQWGNVQGDPPRQGQPDDRWSCNVTPRSFLPPDERHAPRRVSCGSPSPYERARSPGLRPSSDLPCCAGRGHHPCWPVRWLRDSAVPAHRHAPAPNPARHDADSLQI